MPVLVGCPGERVYVVEARKRQGHQGRRPGRSLHEDEDERPAILHEMRRSSHEHHPPLGLVDVYAATIPSVKFVPVVHVNYAETVLPMKDGLPKLKDFPAEMGGSGVALPE
jgi:hypothetical protein